MMFLTKVMPRKHIARYRDDGELSDICLRIYRADTPIGDGH